MDVKGGTKGAIALACVVAVFGFGATASAAGPYIVDTTGDGADVLLDGTCDADAGPGVACSLRAAIQEANNDVAADAITFPSPLFDGNDVISLVGSSLPAITQPATISCQADPAGGQPCVEIDATGFDGITVNADSVTVSDVAVTNAFSAIQAQGTGGNPVVTGFKLLHSWVGLNLDGTTTAAANTTGVFLDPAVSAGQIGDATAAGRNVIANSNSIGLRITGADTTAVSGNNFGTNAAGTAEAGNGVDLKIGGQIPSNTATGTVVGGFLSSGEQATAACDGACNLISGAATGIDLNDTAPHNGGAAADATEIYGNYFGLNQNGSAALASLGQVAVQVGNADGTQIGQGQLQGLNVFGGFGTAIQVFDQGGALNVERNLIGTTPTGGPSPTTAPATGISVIGLLGSPEASRPSVIDNTISATGFAINDELRDNGRYQSNSIGVGAGNVALPLGVGVQLRSTESATMAFNKIGNASGDAISLIAAHQTAIIGNTIGPTAALGNDGYGINLQPYLGTLPTSDTLIGDDDEGSKNVISNNADGAIGIVGADSDDNEIRRNTGSGNGGLFIDLGEDGPGATTGANNNVAPPQLTSVTASAVSGTGAPGATVRVFSKAIEGAGELQAFLGAATVAGDGSWSVAASASTPFVGANQTAPGDGTSELSVGALPVVEPPPPPPAVDSLAPETTITKKPKKKSTKRKATIVFTSSEPGSTFECALDKKPFAPCSSPFKAKRLKPKKHRVQVRATDAAGNVEQTPAIVKFKVKKKK